MKTKHFRTWIEISKSNLSFNYKTIRSLLAPGTKMLGVIKSNAYGHELVGMGKALSILGIDWLGVDSITEALALRSNGVKKPILVMGYTLPENFSLASRFDISLTISGFENLKALERITKALKIHVKIDSGMHRQGFYPDQLVKVVSLLKKSKKTRVEGIFTHFAVAKDPRDTADTLDQIQQLQQAIAVIRQAGFSPLVHAGASGGTFNFPGAHYDLVRAGIALYGLWPAEETQAAWQVLHPLKPILSWKTIVSEIKQVKKGQRIGYDYTETLQRDTTIAILPIGYWHGYWRAFSSKAHVLIRGQRARVLGRVAMDMTVVDVTGIPKVKVGDETVLIGSQGKESVTASELADIAGTSHYEIVTRLNPLIKKYFI